MNSVWVRNYLRELLEAAFPLDLAKQKIRSLQDPIAEHLFKVFFLGSNTAAQHWRGELTGWAKSLAIYNNVKTKSGKAFDFKSLETLLWDEPFGTDEDLRTRASLNEMPEEEVLARKREFKSFVYRYLESIIAKRPWKA